MTIFHYFIMLPRYMVFKMLKCKVFCEVISSVLCWQTPYMSLDCQRGHFVVISIIDMLIRYKLMKARLISLISTIQEENNSRNGNKPCHIIFGHLAQYCFSQYFGCENLHWRHRQTYLYSLFFYITCRLCMSENIETLKHFLVLLIIQVVLLTIDTIIIYLL